MRRDRSEPAEDLKAPRVGVLDESEVADEDRVHEWVEPPFDFYAKAMQTGRTSVYDEDAVLDTVAVAFERLCYTGSLEVIRDVIRDEVPAGVLGHQRTRMPT